MQFILHDLTRLLVDGLEAIHSTFDANLPGYAIADVFAKCGIPMMVPWQSM